MASKDFIKGKTVQNILDTPLFDLKKMTDSELRTVVGRLVSAGNKRLRRYESKKGELPNAGRQGTYEERKFSTQGKDRTELMEEFKRAKNFFGAETSSLTGEKNVKTKSQKALNENFGISVSDEDYDTYWKAFDRLKELHPEIDERNYKYTILSHMDKMIEKRKGKPYKSYKTFVRAIEKKLDDLYKENQRLRNADGTSGFFVL
ncbi:MAG: hypothetical protein VZR95_03815 [Alphaproteobacteria bacterium]